MAMHKTQPGLCCPWSMSPGTEPWLLSVLAVEKKSTVQTSVNEKCCSALWRTVPPDSAATKNNTPNTAVTKAAKGLF